jgi:hypothetical protein
MVLNHAIRPNRTPIAMTPNHHWAPRPANPSVGFSFIASLILCNWNIALAWENVNGQ